MVDEGYAATQILIQLHESIIEQDLNDKQKSAITEKMAVCSTQCGSMRKAFVLYCVIEVFIVVKGLLNMQIFLSLYLQVVDKCLADGADEYLQMLSLCSIIMEQSSSN